MEIIKIAPETLEALQNAPCAQPLDASSTAAMSRWQRRARR